MFPPPGIGFRDPEGVKARLLARLGHGGGFLDGLHAELKDSDIKWDGHFDSLFLLSSFSFLVSCEYCEIKL
jgi:hypothetical protein